MMDVLTPTYVWMVDDDKYDMKGVFPDEAGWG